jgi:hypothetical protein
MEQAESFVSNMESSEDWIRGSLNSFLSGGKVPFLCAIFSCKLSYGKGLWGFSDTARRKMET